MSDWTLYHKKDMWNKVSESFINNEDIKKTIYDPSITGFSLPPTYAFTGLTYNGTSTTNVNLFNVTGNWNSGYRFYSLGWKQGSIFFMNALGQRSVWQSGSISEKGLIAENHIHGRYWIAGSTSSEKTIFITIVSNYINPASDEVGKSWGATCLARKM